MVSNFRENSEREFPSRRGALIFRGKAALLQLRRGCRNLISHSIKKFPHQNNLPNNPVIAESKTALWTENDRTEHFFLAGKIQNLRLAVKKLNGVEIPAGATFSFWAQVGKTGKSKGYVAGRELREGCIVPSTGGGLCQLSNALYDAALQAGFTILERHEHTQIVPGSLAEIGRDATVFWNYVDLRFKSPAAFRIEAKLDATHLTVCFKSRSERPKFVRISPRVKPALLEQSPNSCASCGVEDCFRSLKPNTQLNFGCKAFLVDEFSPEFDSYLQEKRSEKDFIFVPLDGKRFKKANYGWTLRGFAKTRQSLLTTFIRSYKSRRLAVQGARRQRALLEMSEKLAESYAQKLTFDVLHVVVQQNLLPFLWREGHLGGRTFDVLMTALPMENLQERLDSAFSLHPESTTLGDFRAEKWLVEAETEALKNAGRIITPHTEIAGLFAEKAVLLDWQLPEIKARNAPQNRKFKIVFPASTAGRKGVYELREALRGLDVKLIILGAELEGEDFWRGFDVEHKTTDWLEKADLVVLPAFVEHKPRRLLSAASRGVPVIASKACGVGNVKAIISVENGNTDALRQEIEKVIFKENRAVLTAKEIVEII
jgi:hypothetical protein